MPKRPTERYTTVAGDVLEYTRPAPPIARFLARVYDAAHDPRVSESELTGLVYGRENPLLDQSVFPARGAVTRETWENPIWHVMLDLVDAKRMQLGTLPQGERARDQHTLTVSETASALDLTEDAIRKAIRAGDLDAVKRGGGWWVDRQSVATYRDRVIRRGPQRAEKRPVRRKRTKSRSR